MDLLTHIFLTHIFLPLAMIYGVGIKDKKFLLISPLAILPDLDVFLGILHFKP